jgi:hypothetical protein
MSDIVERLRNELGWGIGPALLCQTAADEIERLRAVLQKIAAMDEVSVTDFDGVNDWALQYIQQYGGIDGNHHKAWVLDQVARILHGTPVIVTGARKETLFRTGDPSSSYLEWAEMMRSGGYNYDEGIAP